MNRSHKNTYPESTLKEGIYICYHFFIGTDSTTVALRNLDERPYCTRDIQKNLSSLHIVLAGSPDMPPNDGQIRALKKLLVNINSVYSLKQIIGHKEANSPTHCPGDEVMEFIKGINLHPVHKAAPEKKFVLSRYYTPVPNQPYYYRNYTGRKLLDMAMKHGIIKYKNGKFIRYNDNMIFAKVLGTNHDTVVKLLESDDVTALLIKRATEYAEEFKVNCMGDCLSTASTYRLSPKDAYEVVACPKEYPFGTKFIINGSTFTCWDRGGAITESGDVVRLDIWSGISTDGLNRIRRTPVPENPEVTIVYP